VGGTSKAAQRKAHRRVVVDVGCVERRVGRVDGGHPVERVERPQDRHCPRVRLRHELAVLVVDVARRSRDGRDLFGKPVAVRVDVGRGIALGVRVSDSARRLFLMLNNVLHYPILDDDVQTLAGSFRK